MAQDHTNAVPEWLEEHTRGDAGAFHAREMPTEVTPSVWWFDVDRPALVLGSAQPMAHVDLDACRRLGVDVVRRRSGGGAVLLTPGDVIWVDVLIPTTHHHWTSDVTSSAWWLGEVWRETLSELGVEGVVHDGPMLSTPWSRHVCFAGVGGGEVVAGSLALGADPDRSVSKIVGISQRRTRSGVRFQCALYRHWRPEAHVEVFADPAPGLADLTGLATPVDVEIDALRAAFVDALRRSTPT